MKNAAVPWGSRGVSGECCYWQAPMLQVPPEGDPRSAIEDSLDRVSGPDSR
jgi:hypothetical protein